MRAIRMAQYFDKKEVLFWNMYDSAFIESFGFTVETKHPSLYNPLNIIFPHGVDVVVFGDVPSNELFEYCIYRAALLQHKKIVLCEQMMRRGQFQEPIFNRFVQNADLVLVNALSAFYPQTTDKIKLVPPQIETQLSIDTKTEICQKYAIPADATILFGAGYHPAVFKKVQQLTRNLELKNYNFYTILSGPTAQSPRKHGRLITIPPVTGDDYFKLLYSADIVLLKFGFLQILESLALHKPTVVLGEAGQVLQNPAALDPIFQNSLFVTDQLTEKTQNYIERLLRDPAHRKTLVQRLKRIHNGEIFGAQKAAVAIKKLAHQKSTKRLVMPKRLAILVNNEMFEKAEWLRKNPDIYPLGFIAPMPTTQEVLKRIPTDLFIRPIRDFQVDQTNELLPHSFRQLFVFSRRKYDGFVDIFPWFEDWVAMIELLIARSDEIYLTEQGMKVVGNLLTGKKVKGIA